MVKASLLKLSGESLLSDMQLGVGVAVSPYFAQLSPKQGLAFIIYIRLRLDLFCYSVEFI